MSKWKTVKLSDVGEITSGQGAPQGEQYYSDIGIPFIRAGHLLDLTMGKKEYELKKIEESVAKEHRLKKFSKDTILFAKSGMSCLKGHVYQLENDSYVVNHLACVTPNNKDIYPTYLKYYFMFFRPNRLVIDESYPSIRLGDISNMDILLPPINIQRKIVEVLDRISITLEKRRAQINKLDLLVKSQFVEMFGDPMTHAHKWGVKRLGECCELNPKKAQDGRLTKGLQVSFVPMQLVSEDGAMDPSQIKNYDEVKTGYTYFAEHDVLFAKITPCMENGKGAVAKGLCNGIGFGSTEFHVLRPQQGISNPYWLYTLTSLEQFRMDAAANMTGSAGQRRVPISYLDSFKISLPPIDLQVKFANFVQQVEKQKDLLQLSLSELELKNGALLQKCFRGEIIS